MFEEEEGKESVDSTTMVAELNPVFTAFCSDAEKYLENEDSREKDKVERVLSEYLEFRRSTRELDHVMLLNKIGIERDEKKKRDTVARHCGLRMHEDRESP